MNGDNLFLLLKQIKNHIIKTYNIMSAQNFLYLFGYTNGLSSASKQMQKISNNLVNNEIISMDKIEDQKLDDDFFQYQELLNIIKQDFKLNLYGYHGIYHWQRVFLNTQKLAKYYNVQSEVFELFSILHDSKRENEHLDINHGKRASEFVKKLIEEKYIKLNTRDEEQLIYACANHTKPDVTNPFYNDIIVQICFDADKMDIGRVGIVPDEKYFLTQYAKELIINSRNKQIYIY